MNRSIQVKGAFGVLKNDYAFQRFLLRGKTKVKLEILMLCMGYNINKLHGKIQKTGQGIISFQLKRPHKPQKNGRIIKVCQESGEVPKNQGYFPNLFAHRARGLLNHLI